MNNVRKIVSDAGIKLPNKIPLEISHHYGIEKFDNYKTKLKNYENFFRSVYNEGLLDSLSSINLNFKNQVIVQKK